MVIISEILIMANFGHLLPQKATICDYSMEDSFSNHSVFLSLRFGFEIRIRLFYLRCFGFEIQNLSNFAEIQKYGNEVCTFLRVGLNTFSSIELNTKNSTKQKQLSFG